MPKLNQAGIIHIAIVILLLAGIIAGVYLVQHTQIFQPKAHELLPNSLSYAGSFHTGPGDKCDGKLEAKDFNGTTMDTGWVELRSANRQNILIFSDECSQKESQCPAGYSLKGKVHSGPGQCKTNSDYMEGADYQANSIGSGFATLCVKGDSSMLVLGGDECKPGSSEIADLPDIGCPAGYYLNGLVHSGPGKCDGKPEAFDATSKSIDSGWVALCSKVKDNRFNITRDDCPVPPKTVEAKNALPEIKSSKPSSLIVKRATFPLANGVSCANSSATNKIYCFGGQIDHLTATDQIFEYDPLKDSVNIKNAKLPGPRRYASCTESSLTKKIYCFGGDKVNNIFENPNLPIWEPYKSVVEYDPLTDSISEKNTQLPVAMENLTETSAPLAYPYFAGCAEKSDTKRIYCFGFSAPKYNCREDPRPENLSGKICESSTYLGDIILEYDPSTDRAKLAATLSVVNNDPRYLAPQGKNSFSSFFTTTYGNGPLCVANPATSKIYCFGARIIEYPSKEVGTGGIMYPIFKSALTPAPIYPTHFLMPESCVYHSNSRKIYCFGGGFGAFYHDSASSSNTIFQYDPASDTISVDNVKLPSSSSLLNIFIYTCVTSSANNKIYCLNNEREARNVEILEYTPPVP